MRVQRCLGKSENLGPAREGMAPMTPITPITPRMKWVYNDISDISAFALQIMAYCAEETGGCQDHMSEWK